MSGQEGITCGQCGIYFTVPENWLLQRRAQGDIFYCPNGHCRVFLETTEARLRKEKDAMERALQSQLNTANHLRLAAESALKKETARRRKIEKRIACGVCPCCNRSFEDLQRHMKTKHAEYGLPPATPKQITGQVQ